MAKKNSDIPLTSPSNEGFSLPKTFGRVSFYQSDINPNAQPDPETNFKAGGQVFPGGMD